MYIEIPGNAVQESSPRESPVRGQLLLYHMMYQIILSMIFVTLF